MSQTTEVKVIQHNIAGGAMNQGDPGALAVTLAQVRSWEPDLVLLEEVCEAQSEYLADELPGWHFAYTSMHPGHPDCGWRPNGQVLATPHPLAEVTVDDLGYPDVGPRRVTLTHGLVTLGSGLVVAAGVTHLRAGTTAIDRFVRSRQVARLAAVAVEHADRGVPTIIGGDFNTGPASLALMYPEFQECDATIRPTHTDMKLDYVWVSRRNAGSLSAGLVPDPTSDHLLLRAKAQVHPSLDRVGAH